MPQTSAPLPYTSNQWKLVLADIVLLIRITFVWPPQDGIPSVILPLLPFHSGPLDELYPTAANLYSVFIQLILTIAQAIFLISLPITAITGFNILFPFILIPPPLSAYVPIYTFSVLSFVFINRSLSILLLNGTNLHFVSQVSLSESDIEKHSNEKWIFVNGIACSSHWLQSNLDRLSLTFRREIEGVHNQTRGILFDLIESIIERVFSYATPSTRMVYARLLDVISDSKYDKIVLILHSQGAIEGGLALDWLFATVPAEQLRRVEVYTFGNAANHWNDPVMTGRDSASQRVDVHGERVIKHIEHYANSGDYVSKLGILHFRPLPTSMMPISHLGSHDWNRNRGMYPHDPVTNQVFENRFVGRLFIRKSPGHLLNENYLDYFFTMNKELAEVIDNPFMDGELDERILKEADIVVAQGMKIGIDGCGDIGLERRIGETGKGAGSGKVKDKSRLWSYINGQSPDS